MSNTPKRISVDYIDCNRKENPETLLQTYEDGTKYVECSELSEGQCQIDGTKCTFVQDLRKIVRVAIIECAERKVPRTPLQIYNDKSKVIICPEVNDQHCKITNTICPFIHEDTKEFLINVDQDLHHLILRLIEEYPSTEYKPLIEYITDYFQRIYVKEKLKKHKGNITQASVDADVDINYFKKLIKRYGIDIVNIKKNPNIDDDIDNSTEIIPQFFTENFKDFKNKFISLFQKLYISDLLISNQGNISLAAKAADIDRKFFRKLMRRYSIAS